ncbi:hypothetical protein B0H14DRAFT_3867971 [Mycena olivaceomarginata]|nr:hypothetical protein B0H14DRAFT_3867971 [Mycena olivaceomarginata]
MQSKGGDAIKTGAVQDVWALGTFGSNLHGLPGPGRPPMVPVITEAIKERRTAIGTPRLAKFDVLDLVPFTGVLFFAFFAFGRNAMRGGGCGGEGRVQGGEDTEKEVGAERLRDYVLRFRNSETASTSMTDAEDTSTTYSKPEFTLVLPLRRWPRPSPPTRPPHRFPARTSLLRTSTNST